MLEAPFLKEVVMKGPKARLGFLFAALILGPAAYWQFAQPKLSPESLKDALDSESLGRNLPNTLNRLKNEAAASSSVPGGSIEGQERQGYYYAEVPKIQTCTPTGNGKLCEEAGSGFIIDSERGLIMTNLHLLRRALKPPYLLQVYFYDTVVPGELVKSNEDMNLALVRVSPDFLRQHGLQAFSISRRTEIPPLNTKFYAVASWGQLSILGNLDKLVEWNGKTLIETAAMDLGIKEFIGGPLVLASDTRSVLGVNTLLRTDKGKNRVLTVPIGKALEALGL